MNSPIVCITGLIGSGKDTIADILASEYGYKKLSFASKLKAAVSILFGWDRQMLEGSTPESRHWREQPDLFWSKKFKRNITPRIVLQEFGTDVMRKWHDDFWIDLIEKTFDENPLSKFVITDCRFENELYMLINKKAKLLKVSRGEPPEWYKVATDNQASIEQRKLILSKLNIHSSEYTIPLITSTFNIPFTEIRNNGTIMDLQSKILDLHL